MQNRQAQERLRARITELEARITELEAEKEGLEELCEELQEEILSQKKNATLSIILLQDQLQCLATENDKLQKKYDVESNRILELKGNGRELRRKLNTCRCKRKVKQTGSASGPPTRPNRMDIEQAIRYAKCLEKGLRECYAEQLLGHEDEYQQKSEQPSLGETMGRLHLPDNIRDEATKIRIFRNKLAHDCSCDRLSAEGMNRLEMAWSNLINCFDEEGCNDGDTDFFDISDAMRSLQDEYK